MSRIILHADLDCFYCQVEQKRLNIDPDTPLAIQQWDRIIAINYAARKYGASRHQSRKDCLKKCPTMKFVHVATSSIDNPEPTLYSATQGDDFVVPDRTRHKANLDQYRQASSQILKIFKRFTSILQKASVDEAFLDITEQVGTHASELDHKNCINWELAGTPAVKLDIKNSIDNIRIYIGALLARELRETIKKELGYTCSVGIAHNKMLAKLASSQNKPDQQTFVLSCMVKEFMKTIPLIKIRFLGGKLGQLLLKSARKRNYQDEEESSDSETEDQGQKAADFWRFSKKELEEKVGDRQSAEWVHDIVRGIDNSKVSSQTETKSFMAVKRMRPALKSWELIRPWLLVLSTELRSRLAENFESSSRWPQTLIVGYQTWKGKFHTKSAEFPFQQLQLFKTEGLVDLTEKILKNINEKKGIFPCTLLEMGATRFVKENTSIGTLDKFIHTVEEKNLSDSFYCIECKRYVEKNEHMDYHLALSLRNKFD